MGFQYKYVLPPTGPLDSNIVREMFEDVQGYVNTLISGGGSGAPASSTYVVMSSDGALTSERVLTGTASQVIITDGGAGSTVTLSLPQNIATTSDVQFKSAHLGAGNATDSALFFDAVAEPTKYGYYINDSTFPATSFETLKLRRGTESIVDFYYNATYGKGIIVAGKTDTTPFGTVETPSITIRSDSGGSVLIKAATTSGGYVLTLPIDDGTANDILSTDGSGVLSWIPKPATKALDNLASTAVNVQLNPGTPDTLSLGNSTYRWVTLHTDAVTLYTDSPHTWSTALAAANGLSGNTVFVLPPTNGSNHQVLTTDGAGNTAWGPGTGAGAATTALDNLASVAINTTLVSDTSNTDDLGTSSIPWKRLYTKTGILIQESGAGTDYITIQAPSSISTGYTLTLPVDDGTPNQVLSTDGSGVLSWVTAVTGNANLALSNLASVAVNTALLPGTDSTIALGAFNKRWTEVEVSGHVNVYDPGGSGNYVSICATSGSNAYTFHLPPTVGSPNQYLTTDGTSGVLTWSNAAGTGTVNSGTANRLAYYATTTNAVSQLSAITASKALVSDTNGLPVASAVTSTTLAFLDATSSVQTQIDGKAGTGLAFVTIGNTSSLSAERALTGTSNQVVITDNGANSTVVLSTPQDIHSAATPTFASETLTATTNQLVLGTTRTVTITAPTPASSSRTVTIPDLSASYSVVGTEGTQTINGDKTYGGVIKQTAQPSFLVTHSGATNVTGDGTAYTVAWDAEIYDQGNNFASNTFTAPVAGKYLLTASVAMQDVTAAHTGRYVAIATTAREYRNIQNDTAVPSSAYSLNVTVIADMAVNDTATVILKVSGSTKVVDTVGATVYNYFSGSLIN